MGATTHNSDIPTAYGQIYECSAFSWPQTRKHSPHTPAAWIVYLRLVKVYLCVRPVLYVYTYIASAYSIWTTINDTIWYHQLLFAFMFVGNFIVFVNADQYIIILNKNWYNAPTLNKPNKIAFYSVHLWKNISINHAGAMYC